MKEAKPDFPSLMAKVEITSGIPMRIIATIIARSFEKLLWFDRAKTKFNPFITSLRWIAAHPTAKR